MTGIPVILLPHRATILDYWDPRVVDGIAAKHRVIMFDNRGVGASIASTPETIQESMGRTRADAGAAFQEELFRLGLVRVATVARRHG
jgi:pimeloyl-ACP methyl ester carboxylesterase